MQRRKFLKIMGIGGLASALTVPQIAAAGASHTFGGHPDAVGVLHDSVRCIGCRKCEEGCFNVNGKDLPAYKSNPQAAIPNFADLAVLEEKRRTDCNTYTVVNKYTPESSNKPVFRKQQCNHCQEPACASACFVKAFVKTPEGPVIYKPELCVGCRYCMIACPYYSPTYDYNSAWDPLVYKCTMCAPRIAEGLRPGCVDACPKEALTFGKRSDLIKLAHKRIMEHPGLYEDAIYGDTEMGGTNWLYLSPVPHKELAQPVLGKTSAPELTTGALGAVAMVAGIWPVLLGGAYAISKRRTKMAAADQAAAVKEAIGLTKADASAAMTTALDKAAKDKEASIAREVKKAKEEAIKEYEEKLAAEQAPASVDGEGEKAPETEEDKA